MTRHLSHDEHVAAVEGTLDPARQAHLSGCAACREKVAEDAAVLARVAAAEVPEPSPLFWDHFSARVRQVTAAQPVETSGRWAWGWRAWLAVTGAAVALAAAVTVATATHWSQAPRAATDTAVLSPGAVEPGGGARAFADPGRQSAAEPWAAVVQVASSLSSDDLRGVAPVDADAIPTVDDLTPAERAAFVQLLNHEMEKTQ